ncbi:hypothetical protein XELAEV_18012742mg [Xenopus laevis]|uniref:Uncharacterized protein n=1 Tax=Xenopus laevis TaxID=8355 RepID=A0A974HYJ3_XENLA|nr:hypothetical protein XELAEV_18012742mg [Xenopus laevis]
MLGEERLLGEKCWGEERLLWGERQQLQQWPKLLQEKSTPQPCIQLCSFLLWIGPCCGFRKFSCYSHV